MHTSGTNKPAICLLGFYVVSCNSNALAKNIIPLIRQKSFLEKTKKGGWASDVTGGSGGASPPALEWFHGERLGSARLPPASSGFRVPNFEKRRVGGLEKSTPPAGDFVFAGGRFSLYLGRYLSSNIKYHII